MLSEKFPPLCLALPRTECSLRIGVILDVGALRPPWAIQLAPPAQNACHQSLDTPQQAVVHASGHVRSFLHCNSSALIQLSAKSTRQSSSLTTGCQAPLTLRKLVAASCQDLFAHLLLTSSFQPLPVPRHSEVRVPPVLAPSHNLSQTQRSPTSNPKVVDVRLSAMSVPIVRGSEHCFLALFRIERNVSQDGSCPYGPLRDILEHSLDVVGQSTICLDHYARMFIERSVGHSP